MKKRLGKNHMIVKSYSHKEVFLRLYNYLERVVIARKVIKNLEKRYGKEFPEKKLKEALKRKVKDVKGTIETIFIIGDIYYPRKDVVSRV